MPLCGDGERLEELLLRSLNTERRQQNPEAYTKLLEMLSQAFAKRLYESELAMKVLTGRADERQEELSKLQATVTELQASALIAAEERKALVDRLKTAETSLKGLSSLKQRIVELESRARTDAAAPADAPAVAAPTDSHAARAAPAAQRRAHRALWRGSDGRRPPDH